METEKMVKEYPSGTRYEGEVNADGKPHGRGFSTYPDGRRYEGEWSDGKPHGQGVQSTFSRTASATRGSFATGSGTAMAS